MNRCHEVNSKIGCVNLLFPWWFWFLSTFCSKYSSRAPFSAQISYFTWCSIKGTIIGCISEEKKKVSSGHSKRQCPPVFKRLSLIIDNTCLQFRSVAQLCPTLCDPMNCSTPGRLSITNSRSSPKLMSMELVMPSNHLILCRPLLLPPSIFPSVRVFSNESALHIRWPKRWSFSFNISPSNEHSELISFRMDWLDLLAVQGTLKSLLQRHSSKASVLLHSAFFTVQLSYPYMTI